MFGQVQTGFRGGQSNFIIRWKLAMCPSVSSELFNLKVPYLLFSFMILHWFWIYPVDKCVSALAQLILFIIFCQFCRIVAQSRPLFTPAQLKLRTRREWCVDQLSRERTPEYPCPGGGSVYYTRRNNLLSFSVSSQLETNERLP